MALTLETLDQVIQGEPDWLGERRKGALATYERLPHPSKTDEEWRRTDISGLNPAQFSELEHKDGFKLDALSSLPRGVILEPLRVAAAKHPELVERHLFSLIKADRDRFSALHAAFFTGGTFLYVPEGVVIDEPIVAQHTSHAGGTAFLPHTLIVAGRGARFHYLDEYIGQDDEPVGYRTGSAEIVVGEGAEVGYVAVQKWGPNAWHFGDQRARLDKDAKLRLFTVSLGGRFSKTRVEASLVGQGAEVELKGLYLASGQQFFDFHTLQDHQVGNTRSDLLFKGALQDTARTVYAGLIRIEKGASRSDAYQANRNLVLSDHAKATSIPMLEIDNNDVRCTHGATVGPVDPQHMFYLRSRGIPEPTARRMLVQGFFGDVLDRIPFEHARNLIEADLEARLG
jgi:Fe-S cluster assembly protein SufD